MQFPRYFYVRIIVPTNSRKPQNFFNMKYRWLYTLAALTILVPNVSCKKSSSGPNNSGSGAKLVRIQQGVDPNIANDSVYLITYNTAGLITAVIDSLNKDTLATSYDGNNNLTGWQETYGTSTAFTYNGSQLTEIDQELAGTHNQYVYTYTNNVLSRMDFNSDFGLGGSVSLQNYYLITMTSGNITDIKTYTALGNLQSDQTLTYGSQANTFISMSLFNVGGYLGTDDIFNQLTWFNKNLLTGSLQSGFKISSNYTFNSAQEPVKVVTSDQYAGAVYTWQFWYK